MIKNNITLFVLLLALAGTSLAGASPGSRYRAALEAVVNDYIAFCEARAKKIGSKSDYIRRSAILAHLKATFFRMSKARLIDELAANRIAPERYSVQCFMDDRFDEIARSAKTDFKKGPCPWDRYGYFK